MRHDRAVRCHEPLRSLALPIAFVLGLTGLISSAPVEAGIFTVNTANFARSYDAFLGTALSLSEALRLANGVPIADGRPVFAPGQDCIDNGEVAQINPQGSWAGTPGCWALAASPSGLNFVDTIQFAAFYGISVSTLELLGDGDQLMGNGTLLTAGGAIGLQLVGTGSLGTATLVQNLEFRNFSTAGILCDGCQKAEFYGLLFRLNGTGLLARPNTVALRNPDHLKIGKPAAQINRVLLSTDDGIRIVADPAYTFPADFDIEIQNNRIGEDGADFGNGGDGIELQNIRLAEIGGADPGEGNFINFNNGYGIRIGGASADTNVVRANYIGLDSTGLVARANSAGGILLEAGAGGNTVRDNRIAGNGGPGVDVAGEDSDGNRIWANRIGTTAAGFEARPNEVAGVRIASGADGTDVGECAVPTNGNLISGNNGEGVSVLNSGTTGTEICENLIGTDAAGTGALPNANHGVALSDEASGNTIANNIVAGNGVAGIFIDNSDTNLVDANVVGVAGVASVAGIALIGGSQSNDVEDNVIGAHSFVGLIVAGGSSLNDVYRNRIGTNAAGDAANPNAIGLGVGEASTGNTIGGANGTLGNLISGNSYNGIEVFGAGTSSNTIRFNLVGTNSGGSSALANGNNGILVSSGASSNSFLDNVVSGNTESGISLVSAGTSATLQRNHIGVGSNPATAIPNGFNGIHVSGADGPVNLGGVNPADENLVAHNGLAGLRIEGTATTTLNGQDRFWANGGLAIDLGAAGVTANDLLDADAGPNGTLNMPVIRSARVTAGTLAAELKYHGEPNTLHRIYLYANAACDPALHGEGETVVAQQAVLTDANGHGTTTIFTPGAVGVVLSAVATRNTAPSVVSEFSTCRTAVVNTSPLIFDDSLESGFVDAWSSWNP